MKPKTKNKVLKGITTVSIFILLLAACSDGENLIVSILMFGIPLLWLFVFYLANNNER